ncbi:Holliday junction resolvase RuvX [Paucibacter sp. O1-1]|uniref:Holliday junction resolvase RuvX n=1 Tax=Paucibacter sp. XJ19-41 TaxID=2927824 RepID=UPI0010F99EC6|nr:Holliday junction resolvase RuvX [Paucibacter sp. XJ19-41]MCU7373412.1 Holliday junction resolvase RuvX [Paucibacter sp. O1-1]MDA3828412.1 Holliday junction resolvase RuvX [Paucibacter sp. O1-1]MDC6167198.1 Holliday junction resolvase RuvX [Paucibacter sp. XJ19-41]
MSGTLQSLLAFDYGIKRLGVATGSRFSGNAEPLKSIHLEGDARFEAIARLIKEWQPEGLVIGVPFHPDGAEHEITLRARRFGRQLKGRFRLPVFEVDERYTSVEAESMGARDIDSAAAALILEQFFREHP